MAQEREATFFFFKKESSDIFFLIRERKEKKKSLFFCFFQEWMSITPHSLKFSRSLRLSYLCVPSAAQGISGICAFRPLFHLSHHRVPRPALSRIDTGSRLPSSLPSGWPRPSGEGAARPAPHPPPAPVGGHDYPSSFGVGGAEPSQSASANWV